jgi:tetratricopeptide (TPR) repeat protein
LLKSDAFDSLRFAGFLAAMNNDLNGAIDKYQQADRAKPDQPDVEIPLAEMLFRTNQPDLAEKYCRNLIAKNKNLSQPYDLLYSYYFRLKQPGPAEQILKDKVANNPGQGAFLRDLALHYYLTNRKDEMTATLGRITSDLKTYPNARILVGDFYLMFRDYANAKQQYEQGEKDFPKDKAVYQKRVVEVLGLENKNDEAAKVVADLMKSNPKDPDVIAMHAALLLQTAKRDQIKAVIAELQPLVAKMPASPVLHYDLGLAYQKNYEVTRDKENLEPARLQFQEAVNQRARYVSAIVGLSEVQLELGDSRKALQLADDLVKNIDPRNVRARLVRSIAYMNMNERDKAREELELLLKSLPGLQDARAQLATLDLAEGRYKEAQDEFETLRKTNDPRGLMGLIELKVAQKDFESALSMIREQLKQTPDNMEYQLAQTNIESRAGKFQDAANDVQKMIDKNPKSVDLYLRLGEMRHSGGELKEAEAAFKKAHDLAPSDTTSLLQLGLLYDTSGRNPEARKVYEDILKIQPDNPVALNNLAYAIADDGVDLDQALNYAQRAQQKRPDDLDVMDTLGFIYIRKNLTDDGIRLLKDVVSRRPLRSTYHLHLAMGYYQQGNRAAAKKELEAASHDKPSEKEQVRIKELMAKVG